jgi:hypothetical protein
MKIIGKPYSGKPNVRFDEGELEIEPSATTPALYSTESVVYFLRSCWRFKKMYWINDFQ